MPGKKRRMALLSFRSVTNPELPAVNAGCIPTAKAGSRKATDPAAEEINYPLGATINSIAAGLHNTR